MRRSTRLLNDNNSSNSSNSSSKSSNSSSSSSSNSNSSNNNNNNSSSSSRVNNDHSNNINSIRFPSLSHYTYHQDCFTVDDNARKYFNREIKQDKVSKQQKALQNLKNSNSKISNSIDNNGTGSRCMEALTDFNSNNPFLLSMKSILSFFESKTYNDNGEMKLYDLKPSLISSSKSTFPQRFHTDYKVHQYKDLRKSENIPYIIFFGIDENTTVFLWNEKTRSIIEHKIDVGSVLILALNVIHAGAAYLNVNGNMHKRVQMYMDTDQIMHDYINPNEWLEFPIQNQPLRLVLENRMFTAEHFKRCCNGVKLKDIYNLSKSKIYEALLKDEKSRKRTRSVYIDWNNVSN